MLKWPLFVLLPLQSSDCSHWHGRSHARRSRDLSKNTGQMLQRVALLRLFGGAPIRHGQCRAWSCAPCTFCAHDVADGESKIQSLSKALWRAGGRRVPTKAFPRIMHCPRCTALGYRTLVGMQPANVRAGGECGRFPVRAASADAVPMAMRHLAHHAWACRMAQLASEGRSSR